MRRGSRREARERALELLYEAETKSVAQAELLASLPIPPDAYAEDLVRGVGEHGAEIDAILRRYAQHWELERMPAVDRALLRLAVYELGHRLDVPRNASINEAVELAKRFSTEESGRFVNGMLARIADELRPDPN